MPKGAAGIAHLARRPRGAGTPWPRRVVAWPGSGPLRLEFSEEIVFWKKLDFSKHFDFSAIFCIARTKTDRNWH